MAVLRRPIQNGGFVAGNNSVLSTLPSPVAKSRISLKRKLVTTKLGGVRLLASPLLLTCWCIYMSYSYFSFFQQNSGPRLISEYRSHRIQIEYDVDDNVVSQARILSHEPAQSSPVESATVEQTISNKARSFFAKEQIAYTETESYYYDDDDSYDDDDESRCIPMHEWQTSMFPSCNNLHEIDMMPKDGSFVFINCGGDRCAFQISSNDGRPVALKVKKFSRSFEDDDYEYARKDGVAMERMSASPYFVDIYSYCGLSQVLEYGDGGNLHDLIKTARLNGHDDMDPVDRLKIGIQIVSAVADLHSFEKDGVTSLAHNDLCCHQFIYINGVYKLNDFHLSQFIYKDRDTGEVCQGLSNHASRYDLLHAPEEKNDDRTPVLQEKVDDYMAGNVMYYVLTKHWLYEDVSTMDKALDMLRNGERSRFPKRIRNSKHRADQAMVMAINMLWTHNIKERPSARRVSDFLKKELRQIEGSKLGFIRVDAPPLPKDHRHTDSDFEYNMD